MNLTLAALTCTLAAVSARSAIVTRDIDYEHDGVKLRGFLAYDEAKAKAGKLPGVLVVHEWWGLNDYVRGRAQQLAKLGYAAFAVDMYGAGVLATDPKKAGELAGGFKDPAFTAARARAGLDQLLGTGLVDPSRVAAIGYCFGGTTVQVLAYSGAPLAGIVSFHGHLVPITPEAAAQNKAKILICDGGADPSVKPEDVDAYLKAANDAKVDYKFVIYAGALHAFTNPDSDANVEKFPSMKGFIGYSPTADHRSWKDMRDFFAEIFGPARG